MRSVAARVVFEAGVNVAQGYAQATANGISYDVSDASIDLVSGVGGAKVGNTVEATSKATNEGKKLASAENRAERVAAKDTSSSGRQEVVNTARNKADNHGRARGQVVGTTTGKAISVTGQEAQSSSSDASSTTGSVGMGAADNTRTVIRKPER